MRRMLFVRRLVQVRVSICGDEAGRGLRIFSRLQPGRAPPVLERCVRKAKHFILIFRSTSSTVLKFLNDQAQQRDFDFSSILSNLDGAEDLMHSSEARTAAAEGEAARSSGSPMSIVGLVFALLKIFGVIAILKGLLATFFGENAVKMLDTATEGAELAAVMNSLGVDREQGVKMVKMLFDFMKEKVSPETVEQLVDVVPALKAFLGETKKEE